VIPRPDENRSALNQLSREADTASHDSSIGLTVASESAQAKPVANSQQKEMSAQAKVAMAAGSSCFVILVLCCGGISLMMVVNREETGGFGGSSTPAIKISASQLFQEYENNEVAADEKYKGKSLEVSGRVGSIGKDFLDTIYVAISRGGEFEIFHVQCFFEDKYKQEAASLSKGQQVIIRGRCEGKMGNVMLKRCEFVSKGSVEEIGPRPVPEIARRPK
jgi:hypothetical protein